MKLATYSICKHKIKLESLVGPVWTLSFLAIMRLF